MWAGIWEIAIILAKPVISRTPTRLGGPFDFPPWFLERVSGVEPPPSAWKAEVLPLNYTRLSRLSPATQTGGGGRIRTYEGYRQQIYSLPPLAAWVPLRGQEPAIVLTDPRSVNGFEAVRRPFDACSTASRSNREPDRRPAADFRPPVNWKQGDDVIIAPSVSNDEAKQKFPGGWKSPKPYLRIVPQPR